MFEKPSIQTIRSRMKADLEVRLTGSTSLLPRGLLDILILVCAGAFYIMYGVIQKLSRDILPDQASNDWVDRHGRVWGLERRQATFATGNVTFTGEAGTSIPEGTIIQHPETGSEYSTDEEVNFVGVGVLSQSVSVTANEPGIESNIPADSILLLVSPISGIESEAVTLQGIVGGTSTETDDAYRERILERIRLPVSGGNKFDYIRWAKEVPGVIKAWVFPSFLGAGTVGVVIKSESEELASQVQDHISKKMPVTANVNIEQFVFPYKPSNLQYSISINPYTTAMQDSIIAELDRLHKEQGEPGGILRIAHIRSAIMASGVFDYQLLNIIKDGVSLNVNENINFDSDTFEFPVLLSTTFTEL